MNKHALSCLLGAASVSFSYADTISFKFQDSQDTPFAAGATAGAPGYAQANWNFLQTDWSGNVENDALFAAGIMNSGGSVTTSLANISYPTGHDDPVHYDANNTWRSGAGNADANATLMNGYLDDGGNDQPYVNFSLNPGSLPLYNVVVYVNGDGQGGAVGRYWIEEWIDPLTEGVVITDQVGISSNSYNGTFEQAGADFPQTDTPQNVDVPTGNYIVFTNLTARNFRVRSTGNGDPEDFGRGPLNAIQILDAVSDPDGDDDSDGLLNGWEISFGLDPNSDVGDDGGDGNPDGDGLTNLEEQARQTNPVSADTDSDGYQDEVETGGGTWNGLDDTGTDPLNPDGDGDGLLDGVETNSGIFVDADDAGSNPHSNDTDADTLPDGWEVTNDLDPNDDGTTNVDNGATGDPDMDDSENLEELNRGTEANNDDTDDDNVLDGHEDLGGVFASPTQTGTDPLDPDTDDDGYSDGVESGSGTFVDLNDTGTDPNLHDTDGDGYFDEQEILQGTDPNDANDKPAFPTALGYWSFDDQGETTTADSSPNGNDGTVLGGATYVAGHTGAPGDFAVNFDGIDDAVTTPLSLSNIGFFTMAGWVKYDVAQTNRSGLFGQNDILEFGFNVPDRLHLWSNPGGAIEADLAAPVGWTHIAFVGDGTGRTIYVDGVEAVRGAAATPLNASAFFFNIGGGGVFDDGAVNGNFFEGQIDDVAVWDVSMSPQLIAALANGTITPGPSRKELEITSIGVNTDTNRLDLTVSGTVPGVTYLLFESDDLGSLDPWEEVDDFEGAADSDTTEVISPLSNPVGLKKFYYVTPLAE